MPRKVEPRWGEDGFGDVEPVALKVGQGEKLTEILGFGPQSPQVADLRSAVDDVGTTYRNWDRRGAAAFSRAEARKALEIILQRDRVDYAALTALNDRAFQYVLDALLRMRPSPIGDGETVFAALTGDRLDEQVLRDAVCAGIERLKARKGPDRGGDLAWAVAELCRVYEAVTGRSATLSNKGELLAYESGPRSEAGRFVRLCFKYIDPKVRDSQISRGMRLYLEGRK